MDLTHNIYITKIADIPETSIPEVCPDISGGTFGKSNGLSPSERSEPEFY